MNMGFQKSLLPYLLLAFPYINYICCLCDDTLEYKITAKCFYTTLNEDKLMNLIIQSIEDEYVKINFVNIVDKYVEVKT